MGDFNETICGRCCSRDSSKSFSWSIPSSDDESPEHELRSRNEASEDEECTSDTTLLEKSWNGKLHPVLYLDVSRALSEYERRNSKD